MLIEDGSEYVLAPINVFSKVLYSVSQQSELFVLYHTLKYNFEYINYLFYLDFFKNNFITFDLGNKFLNFDFILNGQTTLEISKNLTDPFVYRRPFFTYISQLIAEPTINLTLLLEFLFKSYLLLY